MAVVFGYPKELPNDPSAADESQYRHARRFIVITDSVDDGNVVAIKATGIPRVGDAHPDEAYAYCKRVRADADGDSRLKFIVTAEYETPPRSTNPGDNNPDPLLRPSEYSWQWAQRNEPVRFAKFTKKIKVQRNGTTQTVDSGFQSIETYPVQNSARTPIDPLPERTVSSPTLRVIRNQASFSAADANLYVDHVNADQFSVAGNTIQPGQAYMVSITADRQYENNVYFWRVTYEIHFREQGWTIDVLDSGDHELVRDAQNKWVKVKIGTEVPEVRNLDGNGAKLPMYDTETPNDILGVFLRYDFSRPAYFGSLGL